MKVNHIYQGDALEVLQSLEAQKVDMCVTSPPYWGLRDYGVDGQLGLEPDFNEYIDKLCTIFDEVRRVLKEEGTCWVNIGDSYSSTRWSNSPSTTGISGTAGFHPGTVLDPFMGSGTTAAVAKRLNRNYVGIELNPEYHGLIHKRLDKTARIKPLNEYGG